ncbi:MAG: cell division protein ZapA [Bryobacteraceae bacterium]
MDIPGTAKQIVRVNIFNQTYAISASGNVREVEDLAREIDDLMAAIAKRSGGLDTTRTAVLACLHLADRLKTVERELSEFKQSVSHKSRDFASLLDRAFADSIVPEG